MVGLRFFEAVASIVLSFCVGDGQKDKNGRTKCLAELSKAGIVNHEALLLLYQGTKNVAQEIE